MKDFHYVLSFFIHPPPSLLLLFHSFSFFSHLFFFFFHLPPFFSFHFFFSSSIFLFFSFLTIQSTLHPPPSPPFFQPPPPLPTSPSTFHPSPFAGIDAPSESFNRWLLERKIIPSFHDDLKDPLFPSNPSAPVSSSMFREVSE